MPDDYFCPTCGGHTQREPGLCPICRTPLATLGEEAQVNDEVMANEPPDLFGDESIDDEDDDLTASRVNKEPKNLEEESTTF